jgi:hypothetical protein
MKPEFVVPLSNNTRIAFYRKEDCYLMLYEYLTRCSVLADQAPVWDDGYAGDSAIKIQFSEFPSFIKGFSRLEKLLLLK